MVDSASSFSSASGSGPSMARRALAGDWSGATPPNVPSPVAPQPSPSQAQSTTPAPSNQPAANQHAAPTEQFNAQYNEQMGMAPEYSRPQPEELLVEWQAPNRPHKSRGKQFYTTVGVIVILISLILFFAGQLMPIAVVMSVAFLVYIMNAIPPEIVTNQITTYGIRLENELYYWDELGRFWFVPRYGQPVLHIEVARFPFRLTILLGDIREADMTELLSEILLNQRPTPTFFERAAEWLQEKVPLDAD